ncbi:hypothetical protein Taro_003857 [Colocasia esculenta]|uniref:Uncharacterized protein n=1 Tax=Colocasia esculenta TaxID=4460 RepID=A0A843TNF2_COLES|nr:hypothetical protein [Colocasia esculenta]
MVFRIGQTSLGSMGSCDPIRSKIGSSLVDPDPDSDPAFHGVDRIGSSLVDPDPDSDPAFHGVLAGPGYSVGPWGLFLLI